MDGVTFVTLVRLPESCEPAKSLQCDKIPMPTIQPPENITVATLSPIVKLPDELLSEVFICLALCAPSQFSFPESAILSPSIMVASRRWRAVAISTLELFTYIKIKDDCMKPLAFLRFTSREGFKSSLKSFLSLGNHALLEIDIESNRNAMFQIIWSPLLSQLRRWRRVTLNYLSVDRLKQLLAAKITASNLLYLSITTDDDDEEIILEVGPPVRNPLLDCSLSMPNLKSLHLCSEWEVFAALLHTDRPTLETLYTDQWSKSSIKRINAATPNLTDLQVNVHRWGMNRYPAHVFPTALVETALQLDKLKSCSLSTVKGWIDNFTFLSDCPNLTSLVVSMESLPRVPNFEHQAPIYTILDLGLELKTLFDPPNRWTGRFLKLFPHVIRLKLFVNGTSGSVLGLPTTASFHLFDAGHFLNVLLHVHPNGENTLPGLCQLVLSNVKVDRIALIAVSAILPKATIEDYDQTSNSQTMRISLDSCWRLPDVELKTTTELQVAILQYDSLRARSVGALQ